MHPNPRRAARALLTASVVTVGVASAQTFDLADAREIPWDPGATVKHTAAGDFTGDARVDAAVQAGTAVYVVYSPDKHNAILQANDTSSPANDIAVLPAASAADKDELVVVGASGLFRLEFDYAEPGYFTSTSIGGSTAWNGGSCLSCADINRDGYPDLLGVNSARTSALITYGPNFTATTTISLGGAVAQDACMVDWSDAGTGDMLDLAVLVNGAGIFVTTFDGGTPGAMMFTTGVGGALAPVRAAAGDPTRVAALIVQGNGDEDLLVWDATTNETVSLTTDGAYALAVGDIDNDGDEEVAVAHTGDQYVYLYENQGAFSSSYSEQIDMGDAYANVHPVLANFRGAGVDDVLSYSATDDVLILHDNGNTGVIDEVAAVNGGGFWFFEEDLGDPNDPNDDVPAYAELELRFDMDTSPPYAYPANATHLEITQWGQNEWGYTGKPSTEPPMNADALMVDHINVLSFAMNGSCYVQLDIDDEVTNRVFHLEMRFVRKVGGNIEWAGPSRTLVFTSNIQMVSVLTGRYGGTLLKFDIGSTPPGGPWDTAYADSRPEEDVGSVDTPDIPDPDEPAPNPNGPPGGGGAGPGGPGGGG